MLSAAAARRKRRAGGRGIYGSVFTVMEAERVSDKRRLDRLHGLHVGRGPRGGRIPRSGRAHLAWKVPESTKRRYRLPGRSKDIHWLVPQRLPSTPPYPAHHRVIYGRVNGRVYGFKGSGTRTPSAHITEEQKAKEADRASIPYHYVKGNPISTQRFQGGALRQELEHEIESAETLRNKFRSLRRKDPVISSAMRHGITAFPTFEPIALFKPLQYPAEYSLVGGTPSEEHLTWDHPNMRTGSNFKGKLRKGERAAFDLLVRRKRKKDKPITLKISDPQRHVNLPEEILEQHRVMAYSVEHPMRVIDMEPGAASHRNGKLALNKPFAYDESLDAWHTIFEKHGFELKKAGEEKDKELFDVFKKQGKTKKRVRVENAALEIGETFARKLGTGIYTVHKYFNGTFSAIGARSKIFSSLVSGNVTVMGEIMDLDTVDLGPGNKTIQQAQDFKKAEDTLKTFTDLLHLTDSQRERVFQVFHSIAREGKPA